MKRYICFAKDAKGQVLTCTWVDVSTDVGWDNLLPAARSQALWKFRQQGLLPHTVTDPEEF